MPLHDNRMEKNSPPKPTDGVNLKTMTELTPATTAVMGMIAVLEGRGLDDRSRRSKLIEWYKEAQGFLSGL